MSYKLMFFSSACASTAFFHKTVKTGLQFGLVFVSNPTILPRSVTFPTPWAGISPKKQLSDAQTKLSDRSAECITYLARNHLTAI